MILKALVQELIKNPEDSIKDAQYYIDLLKDYIGNFEHVKQFEKKQEDLIEEKLHRVKQEIEALMNKHGVRLETYEDLFLHDKSTDVYINMRDDNE